MRRLRQAARRGRVVVDHSTTAGPGTLEPFGVPSRREASDRAVRLAALRDIAGIPPQHPLQLLDRQPAPEASPRVLLRPSMNAWRRCLFRLSRRS